jgi:hypothetical protein
MNLISAEDDALISQAMDDIWDTFQEDVTIVKEPSMTVSNMAQAFIPGFGLTASEGNLTPVTESRTFPSLSVEKHPDKIMNIITTKEDGIQHVLLKVKLDARDYIRDGRKNLHAIYKGRTYNIVSDEETADIGSKNYYIFRIEVTR